MRYTTPLLDVRLLRRYKRFLADVQLPDGEMLTVHCPNSGSMAGLLRSGAPARISGPHGAHRKLRYSLEQLRVSRPDGRRIWVGVNTQLPNQIAGELLHSGGFEPLRGYSELRSEVKLGSSSRIDFLLEGAGRPRCWVEVKNCTMVQSDPSRIESINRGDIATFPDAVTTRGAKHLQELVERVRAGERGVMLFTVQRSDSLRFAPALAFDPVYSAAFAAALTAGVEAYALPAKVSRRGVRLLSDPLPMHQAGLKRS